MHVLVIYVAFQNHCMANSMLLPCLEKLVCISSRISPKAATAHSRQHPVLTAQLCSTTAPGNGEETPSYRPLHKDPVHELWVHCPKELLLQGQGEQHQCKANAGI